MILLLMLLQLTVDKFYIKWFINRATWYYLFIFDDLLFVWRLINLFKSLYRFVFLTCLFVTTLGICYMIPSQNRKSINHRIVTHPIIPLRMWRMRYILCNESKAQEGIIYPPNLFIFDFSPNLLLWGCQKFLKNDAAWGTSEYIIVNYKLLWHDYNTRMLKSFNSDLECYISLNSGNKCYMIYVYDTLTEPKGGM